MPFQPHADTLTYEPYFGLNEKPFSLNADPRFVYDSPTHVATSESLLAGIRRREGLLVLTGEIGTGKTTLCRAVLRDLGRKTYSSLVPDPFASREDLLKMLLIDFGVMSIQELTAGPLRQASRTELGYLLSEFLDSLAPDAFVVVIIDEAQNLSLPLIEETRILSDTFGAKGRLQIVFVGQPELHAKLKLPEMRQVDQRVCGYHRLAPMSREAVAGYIQHRLQVAGGRRDRVLFPPEVVDGLHQPIRRRAAADQPDLRSRAAPGVRAAGRRRGPGDPRHRADRGRLRRRCRRPGIRSSSRNLAAAPPAARLHRRRCQRRSARQAPPAARSGAAGDTPPPIDDDENFKNRSTAGWSRISRRPRAR